MEVKKTHPSPFITPFLPPYPVIQPLNAFKFSVILRLSRLLRARSINVPDTTLGHANSESRFLDRPRLHDASHPGARLGLPFFFVCAQFTVRALPNAVLLLARTQKYPSNLDAIAYRTRQHLKLSQTVTGMQTVWLELMTLEDRFSEEHKAFVMKVVVNFCLSYGPG